MPAPFEINPEEVTEIRQTWASKGSKFVPIFFARINDDRMKRISLVNGLRLIDAGKIRPGEQLKKWIHDYYAKV